MARGLEDDFDLDEDLEMDDSAVEDADGCVLEPDFADEDNVIEDITIEFSLYLTLQIKRIKQLVKTTISQLRHRHLLRIHQVPPCSFLI